jgi:hypothetical protein
METTKTETVFAAYQKVLAARENVMKALKGAAGWDMSELPALVRAETLAIIDFNEKELAQ